MRSFMTIAFLGAATAVSQTEINFMEFIVEHGKSYGTIEEFNFRMAEFEKIEKAIVEHRSSE
jgi:hypothetical protein